MDCAAMWAIGNRYQAQVTLVNSIYWVQVTLIKSRYLSLGTLLGGGVKNIGVVRLNSALSASLR